MACEHADLARRAGHDEHLGEPLERHALRRDEGDLERLAVGQGVAPYEVATGSASTASSAASSASGSSAASGIVTEPRAASIASSIVPTM